MPPTPHPPRPGLPFSFWPHLRRRETFPKGQSRYQRSSLSVIFPLPPSSERTSTGKTRFDKRRMLCVSLARFPRRRAETQKQIVTPVDEVVAVEEVLLAWRMTLWCACSLAAVAPLSGQSCRAEDQQSVPQLTKLLLTRHRSN